MHAKAFQGYFINVAVDYKFKTKALIDTGSSIFRIDAAFVRKHNIPIQPLEADDL